MNFLLLMLTKMNFFFEQKDITSMATLRAVTKVKAEDGTDAYDTILTMYAIEAGQKTIRGLVGGPNIGNMVANFVDFGCLTGLPVLKSSKAPGVLELESKITYELVYDGVVKWNKSVFQLTVTSSITKEITHSFYSNQDTASLGLIDAKLKDPEATAYILIFRFGKAYEYYNMTEE